MSARPSPVPLRRVSTVEAVAGAIHEQVLDGTLPAGTSLREAELCEAFGVSRHTVRTALQALSHEGLVRHEPNRGVFVRVLTVEDVADLYRLRILLEVEAARTLAGRTESLGPARAALDVLRATSAPWGAVRDADLAFHRAIVDALGSPRISRTFASLMTEFRLIFRQLRDELEDHALVVRQHEEILEALEGAGARAAAKTIKDHLDDARDQIVAGAGLPSAGSHQP